MGAVLRSPARGVTITICHNKPPDRKWGWNVDVVPGRDGPENLRILKKSQLRLDHGGREVEFQLLKQRVDWFLGLVTLFHCISSFVGYLMPNLFSKKNSCGTI